MGPRTDWLASGAVQRAISASNFRDVPREALPRLLAGARPSRLRAGATLHPEGTIDAHFELVIAGLVRAFVAAPDGRTLTVRYARPGAILGAASVFARDFSLPATIQAIVDSEILVLEPDAVRAAVRADPAAADAVLAELGERVQSFLVELQRGAFAPVRQRVARHVLDLATESQRSTDLVAEVSQEELAAACGTVREGVARVLSEFRREGLVETRRGAIAIVEPASVVAIALGEDGARA